MKTKIKVGVIGAGHLGRFHIEKLLRMNQINLIGFYDTSSKQSKKIYKEFNVPSFDSIDNLINKCDAITIATPTTKHYECGIKSLKNNCHIFVEKPFTNSVKQASELVSIANKKDLIIQVGHIEQFNPAFLAIKKLNIIPNFIETHRLSPFPGRGFDVPVVLDLMIHDIGILLKLVNSEVKSIHAYGQSIVSTNIDLANTRLEFENGCVANLTASRISLKKMRKMRVFQNHRYLTIDFLNHIVEDFRATDNPPDLPDKKNIFQIGGSKGKYVLYNNIEVESHDALELELTHFFDAIKFKKNQGFSGKDATKALKLAIDIQNKIKSKLEN